MSAALPSASSPCSMPGTPHGDHDGCRLLHISGRTQGQLRRFLSRREGHTHRTRYAAVKSIPRRLGCRIPAAVPSGGRSCWMAESRSAGPWSPTREALAEVPFQDGQWLVHAWDIYLHGRDFHACQQPQGQSGVVLSRLNLRSGMGFRIGLTCHSYVDLIVDIPYTS